MQSVQARERERVCERERDETLLEKIQLNGKNGVGFTLSFLSSTPSSPTVVWRAARQLNCWSEWSVQWRTLRRRWMPRGREVESLERFYFCLVSSKVFIPSPYEQRFARSCWCWVISHHPATPRFTNRRSWRQVPWEGAYSESLMTASSATETRTELNWH